MQVFSEERIFHQTFWTTTTSSERIMNLPPCPSSSFIELPPFVPPCLDNNNDRRRMDNELPILEPSPTFAWTTQRDPLRPVSPTGMSGITPPSSPLAFTPSLSSSSSLSPSSALRGFGFGSIREVRMGGNPRGFGCEEGMALDEPIQLPPIRASFPADGSEGMEGIISNNNNVTRFVPVKTETNNNNANESPKGKKLGVCPVSFKKSPTERKTLNKQGKIAGILVVHTTTQSTVTSVERKVSPYPAPVSPPFTTTTFTATTTATPSATLSKKPTSSKNSSSVLNNNNTHNNNTHNNNNNDACDGNRRRVTPEQLAILEREFERGMIPDLETRKRLAKQLGFTERRVQVWFQNRRAKMKKDNVGPHTPIFIVNCGIESFRN